MVPLEYLLTCLSEEAGEVTQAVSKTIRFGLDSKHPSRGGDSNELALFKELMDMNAVFEILVEQGLISPSSLMSEAEAHTHMEAKKAKVMNYMQQAAELGMLQDFAVTEPSPNIKLN